MKLRDVNSKSVMASIQALLKLTLKCFKLLHNRGSKLTLYCWRKMKNTMSITVFEEKYPDFSTAYRVYQTAHLLILKKMKLSL
jgi:hypothetical protein